jgi:hypothetical protein
VDVCVILMYDVYVCIIDSGNVMAVLFVLILLVLVLVLWYYVMVLLCIVCVWQYCWYVTYYDIDDYYYFVYVVLLNSNVLMIVVVNEWLTTMVLCVKYILNTMWHVLLVKLLK